MVRKHISGPFVFPVRDILRLSGEMREFHVEVPAPDVWGEGLVSVAKDQPIDLDLRLEAVHEGILATAEVTTEYSGVCGRCLIDIVRPVEVEFQELFGYSGDEATDFEIQGDHLDCESLVRDAIVLSLPFQPVCQPDCPGLDPVTGERLTTEAANDPREPADARWSALQTFTHDAEAARPGAEKTEES